MVGSRWSLRWPGVVLAAGFILACGGGQPGATPTAQPSPTPSATVCTPAEPGWRQVNQLKGFLIHDGYVGSDSCRMVLVGERVSPSYEGAVLLSDDGGSTTRVVASFPQASNLWRVVFQDAKTGWVAGDTKHGQGLLLKSGDGGASWEEVPLPAEVSIAFTVAVSGREVWVAGVASCAGVLLESSDSGATWREAFRLEECSNIVALAISGPTIIAIGYEEGRGAVLTSNDGGQTFERSSSASGLLTAGQAVAMVGSQEAYVSGLRLPYPDAPTELGTWVLLRSTDGGQQWEEVPLPAEARGLGDVLAVSAQRLYGIAWPGTVKGPDIVMSEDAGRTWEVKPLEPPAEIGVERLFRGDNGTLYAVGASGLYWAQP